MIAAILHDEKTQTRRVILRREKDEGEWVTARPDRGYTAETIAAQYRCPFGSISDRLWVKETFASLCFYRDWETGYIDGWDAAPNPRSGTLVFNADPHGFDDCGATVEERGFAWTPAIFMPRWASRITLEVTGVRVQRLWDITNEDAIAEGCTGGAHVPGFTDESPADPYEEYAELWDTLNAHRGYGWDKNPWVWVVEFRRVVEPVVELAFDPSWSTPKSPVFDQFVKRHKSEKMK
jgi:hypothetical protein